MSTEEKERSVCAYADIESYQMCQMCHFFGFFVRHNTGCTFDTHECKQSGSWQGTQICP